MKKKRASRDSQSSILDESQTECDPREDPTSSRAKFENALASMCVLYGGRWEGDGHQRGSWMFESPGRRRYGTRRADGRQSSSSRKYFTIAQRRSLVRVHFRRGDKVWSDLARDLGTCRIAPQSDYPNKVRRSELTEVLSLDFASCGRAVDYLWNDSKRKRKPSGAPRLVAWGMEAHSPQDRDPPSSKRRVFV